jgi:hypothetical protein
LGAKTFFQKHQQCILQILCSMHLQGIYTSPTCIEMVDHRKSSIDVATNISLQTQLSCYYHTNVPNVCRIFIHGSINSMGGCFPIIYFILTIHFD